MRNSYTTYFEYDKVVETYYWKVKYAMGPGTFVWPEDIISIEYRTSTQPNITQPFPNDEKNRWWDSTKENVNMFLQIQHKRWKKQ